MSQLLKSAQVEQRGPQLLVPSDAVWYPLHGDAVSAVPTLPTLALTSAAVGNWNAQGYYAFPSGNTTDVLNSDNSLTLDAVFSMAGMEAGNQWIFAHEMTTPNHSATGFIWTYGNDGGTASYYALGMINTEVLQLSVRGANDSSAARVHQWASNPLGLSGTRCTIVLSIEAQSATTVLARILKSTIGVDATPVDFGYSVPLDVRGAGSANPSRNGFVNHAGLSIAGRPTTGWTPANRLTVSNYGSSTLFGNGSGTGRIGNFQARKFANYSSTRQAAVMADLLAKPREFSATLAA